MALFLLNLRIFIEHEPLRPIAVFLILMRKYGKQNVPNLLVLMGCHKIFDRTLAYVTCPPSSPAILLQAMRDGIMDKHIVGVPPGKRVNFKQITFVLSVPRQLESVHYITVKSSIALDFRIGRTLHKRQISAMKKPLMYQCPF
ncbi:hypothetical protein D3C74_284690 [compost metagenome]